MCERQEAPFYLTAWIPCGKELLQGIVWITEVLSFPDELLLGLSLDPEPANGLRDGGPD